MSQYFEIHPDNPQHRLIRSAVEIIRSGGVVVYPTDSSYAIGCQLDDKTALERIRRIRDLDAKHNFTLVCRDLSEISTYARVDNSMYRLLKAHTPGAYTFIFKATSQVPRRLQHPKRKTIGIRIPDNNIVAALLEELGEPMMSSTLIMPGDDVPMSDPEEIRERLEKHVDLVINGGYCGLEPTTVVVCSDKVAEVVREGKGDSANFS